MKGKVPADCPHCFHHFDVSPDKAGGIVNCPKCQKAVEIEGLNDPLWRLLQAGAAIAGAVLTVFVAKQFGVTPAIVVALSSALLFTLFAKCL